MGCAAGPTPLQALSGRQGYGESHNCIQDPGAQAGAYVYMGTSVGYEAPDAPIAVPDSLQILFVNYVGRHGSRFISKPDYTRKLSKYLRDAGELTPVGRRALRMCAVVDSVTGDRWGLLDDLGRRELSGIGERMSKAYAPLLDLRDSLLAETSTVPRCMMSASELTHAMLRCKPTIELRLGSGDRFSSLLRGFSTDKAYRRYVKEGSWKPVLDAYRDTVCPTAAALRLTAKGSALLEKLGRDCLRRGVQDSGAGLEAALADTLAREWPAEWSRISGLTKAQAIDIAQKLYKVVSGSFAMGYSDYTLTAACDWRLFFTTLELYDLWACSDLDRYLHYSDSGLSDAPSGTARTLLGDLTATLRKAAEPDYNGPAVIVRLGHAETLMPLYSLMQMPGASLNTSDWNSVPERWLDFEIVPMAANLQMVLARSHTSGRLYLLQYRNELPVAAPEPLEEALSRYERLLK